MSMSAADANARKMSSAPWHCSMTNDGITRLMQADWRPDLEPDSDAEPQQEGDTADLEDMAGLLAALCSIHQTSVDAPTRIGELAFGARESMLPPRGLGLVNPLRAYCRSNCLPASSQLSELMRPLVAAARSNHVACACRIPHHRGK